MEEWLINSHEALTGFETVCKEMNLKKEKDEYVTEIMSQANKNETIYELFNRLTVNKCFLMYIENEKCNEWKNLDGIPDLNVAIGACNAVL